MDNSKHIEPKRLVLDVCSDGIRIWIANDHCVHLRSLDALKKVLLADCLPEKRPSPRMDEKLVKTESVEDFLARGGVIKREPTAAEIANLKFEDLGIEF